LIEWFIIAFITFADTDQIKVKLMQEGFDTRASCLKYLKHTPSVINDIQLMEPHNNGMWFQCLDTNQVKEYAIQQQAI